MVQLRKMMETTVNRRINESVSIVFCVGSTLKRVLFVFANFFYTQNGEEPSLNLKKYFQFEELGTNYRTEFMAGLTTFLAMAYILFVNPQVLSLDGVEQLPEGV